MTVMGGRGRTRPALRGRSLWRSMRGASAAFPAEPETGAPDAGADGTGVEAPPAAAEEAGASLFVLDGAVIVGTEAEAECDRLAVVTAPFETSVARIAKRDGIAPEMAARRLNAQTPEEALLARADYVLRNDADLAALEAAANALCEQLLAEGGTKGGARPSV